MTNVERLLRTNRPFLTDGGLETWLFFQQGFEAPEFAAIVLMDDDAARQAMRRYFEGFLKMAEAAQTGFLLDTNTWRGCTHWAPKLDRPAEDMLRLSSDDLAVAFLGGVFFVISRVWRKAKMIADENAQIV